MAQVNWTDQAKEDLHNIIDYIALQSETYAKIQAQRIFDKVDLLENMPYIGRVVPELIRNDYRELIIGSYRVVYHLIDDNSLDIIAVHHSSMLFNIKG